MHGNRRPKGATAKQISELAREGKTAPEIARQLGIRVPTVRIAARRHNIALPRQPRGSRAKLSDQTVRDIRKAIADGESYAAVSERTGVGLRSITLIVRRETYGYVS